MSAPLKNGRPTTSSDGKSPADQVAWLDAEAATLTTVCARADHPGVVSRLDRAAWLVRDAARVLAKDAGVRL